MRPTFFKPNTQVKMEISIVHSKRQLKRFIDFPHDLYKNDPYYVPELYISQKELLTKENPFFEHSDACLFLVDEGKKILGRIAAIENRVHNGLYGEKTGFFGFFESVDNVEVASLLFKAALNWCRQKGLLSLLGPINFTTNDPCGLLIDGFDRPPVVMMPYNKAYYKNLFENMGFIKEMDLFSYEIHSHYFKQAELQRLIVRSEEKIKNLGISIRPIQFQHFEKEIVPLRKVYNESNKDNWGFTPLNEKEFRKMARELKMLVPENLVLVAELNEEMIAYILTLPDFNQVFRHIGRGRLFPFGFFKLLYYRKKINRARIMILGIDKKHRNKGIDLVFYNRINQHLDGMGIFQAEACYVMESNRVMNSVLSKLGCQVIKRYRIFRFPNTLVE